MRAINVATVLGVAVLLVACNEQSYDQSPVAVDVRFSEHAGDSHNFGAVLSSGEEVPVNASNARGSAIFSLSADGATLAYKLIVANIQNVTQAHIHCGPAGVNGPVILWLYPSAPPATLIPGRSQGIIGEGTAGDAQVFARPNSSACPGGVATLADVVEKLRTGGAYANVHTTAFPPGEIRGQVGEHGPTQ